MKSKYTILAIFVLAIIVRFYCFRESVYFGFDEARDAFVSQAIYKQGDLKIVGPAASGVTGLNHGVLHWYLIGVIYLVGMGNPFVLALVFRVINALAIFPIYWITKELFGKRAGLMASVIFAVSFEATQYSIYYGNPSWAVWSWILLFAGAVIIYNKPSKFWGLPLMAIGIATGIHFELFLMTMVPVGAVILFILRRELKKLSVQSWVVAVLLGLGIMSTFIIGEVKNGFRSIGLILGLATNTYNAASTEPKWITFLNRWILMFHDNYAPLDQRILWMLGLSLAVFLLFRAIQKTEYKLILLWVFGGVFVTIIGSYNAYYVNVGLGTGVIIGLAVLIDYIWGLKRYLGVLLIGLSIWGNISQVRLQNRYGLIQDIKTQQYMQLSDEVKVINQMYIWANKEAFTVRVTSMPYKIQTVWAYVFNQFGLPIHGYLPYYETGNTPGYPGLLPAPKSGTTCTRFLLKEPGGGIPKLLFDNDESEENLFSTTTHSVQIGAFTLQKRISKDKICFTDNYPN